MAGDKSASLVPEVREKERETELKKLHFEELRRLQMSVLGGYPTSEDCKADTFCLKSRDSPSEEFRAFLHTKRFFPPPFHSLSGRSLLYVRGVMKTADRVVVLPCTETVHTPRRRGRRRDRASGVKNSRQGCGEEENEILGQSPRKKAMSTLLLLPA